MEVVVSLIVGGVNVSVITSPSVAVQLRLAYACALNLPLAQVLFNATHEVGVDGSLLLYSVSATVNALTAAADACALPVAAVSRLRALRAARVLTDSPYGTRVDMVVVVTPGPNMAYAGLYEQAAALTAIVNAYINDANANGTASSNPLTLGLLSFAATVGNDTGALPATVFGGMAMQQALLLAPAPPAITDANPSSTGGGGITGNQVVGVVIGAISGVAIFGVVALVVYRRRNPGEGASEAARGSMMA